MTFEELRPRELWRDISEMSPFARQVGPRAHPALADTLSRVDGVLPAVVPSRRLAAIGVSRVPSIVGPLTAGVIVVSVALLALCPPWLLVAFLLVGRGIRPTSSPPARDGARIESSAIVIFVLSPGESWRPRRYVLSVPSRRPSHRLAPRAASRARARRLAGRRG